MGNSSPQGGRGGSRMKRHTSTTSTKHRKSPSAGRAPRTLSGRRTTNARSQKRSGDLARYPKGEEGTAPWR